jgi:hypothetical protein
MRLYVDCDREKKVKNRRMRHCSNSFIQRERDCYSATKKDRANNYARLYVDCDR